MSALLSPTEPASLATPAWIEAAFELHARTVDRLPAGLEERLERLVAHLGGGQSLRSLLLSASATPVLTLMDAYRSDLGIAERDPRMAAVGEGALALYMNVRVQDDLIDEPERFDRGHVYLSAYFAEVAAEAFERALPGSTGFAAFRSRALREFLAFAAVDLESRGRRQEPPTPAECGAKFLPLAVLLGAVAHLAGRAYHGDEILRFTRRLGSGLQAINDLLNSAEDHRAGQVTPVLSALYRGGRVTSADTPDRVAWALLQDSTLRTTLDAAACDLRAAAEIARGMGALRLARAAASREAFLESVPRRLLSLSLLRRVEWD